MVLIGNTTGKFSNKSQDTRFACGSANEAREFIFVSLIIKQTCVLTRELFKNSSVSAAFNLISCLCCP